ncbi:hypothetical protein K474DRAFT_702740 [Panus rudis PR-1116 ss-1]|nr:hypothetical protein K474DRAFT_702740 [Panus rudis PR-1116 ss-1]
MLHHNNILSFLLSCFHVSSCFPVCCFHNSTCNTPITSVVVRPSDVLCICSLRYRKYRLFWMYLSN